MPVSVQPLLVVRPALPAPVLLELHNMLNTVVRAAFGQRVNLRIHLVQPASSDTAVFELILPADDLGDILRETALRLAETALQLLKVLAEDLRVPIRQIKSPSRRMLALNGLAWHLTRCRLTKILSALESPTSIELASAYTGLRLRISVGRPLGYAAIRPTYLCGTVIGRRDTSLGEVVRIRCGRTPMSVIIPREINGAAVSDGVVISTIPVVGRIPRRLETIANCQLSLFRDS